MSYIVHVTIIIYLTISMQFQKVYCYCNNNYYYSAWKGEIPLLHNAVFSHFVLKIEWCTPVHCSQQKQMYFWLQNSRGGGGNTFPQSDRVPVSIQIMYLQIYCPGSQNVNFQYWLHVSHDRNLWEGWGQRHLLGVFFVLRDCWVTISPLRRVRAGRSSHCLWLINWSPGFNNY